MSASKRPSTSSLRRFITSRPYVSIPELRRRFALDDPDAMSGLAHDGRTVYVGLPEREALKLEDLLRRNEVGLEMSVEVRAPVVVGVYPMRIARYLGEGLGAPGVPSNGVRPADVVMTAAAAVADRADGDGAAPGEATTEPGLPGDEAALATDDGPEPGALPADGDGGDPLGAPDARSNGQPVLGHGRTSKGTRHNGRRLSHRRRAERNHRGRGDLGGRSGETAPGPR